MTAGRHGIFYVCGETLPNLQGIWTGTYDVPWGSDYTQNGNLQTAILVLLPTGNLEGMRRYFNYGESLMEDYRINSQVLYHCGGSLDSDTIQIVPYFEKNQKTY